MAMYVLLVDPDECIVDGFARSLRGRGFRVLTASNKLECERQMCDFAPHVLVLEPDAKGSWSWQLLMDRSRSNDPPMVIVSRFSPHGFNHNNGDRIPWLTKPIRFESLVNAISDVLDCEDRF